MTTIFDETNPLDTDFVGEADDDIRAFKAVIKTAFALGHFVEDDDDPDYDVDRDGMLKYAERVKSISGTIEPDLNMIDGTFFEISVTANSTVSFDFTDVDYDAYGWMVIVKQDSTGGREITWPTGVKWAYGQEPETNDNSLGITICSFFSFDGGITVYGTYMGEYS